MSNPNEKRNLSNSDDNQSDEKRQRQEAENLAPAWARGLIRDIATLSVNVNAIKIDIGELKHNFSKLEDKICAIEMRCDNIEDNTLLADERVAALESKLESISNLLNDQVDRGLRKKLSIHNIPKTKAKENWEETACVVARFLADNFNGGADFKQWRDRIERAHRGKTDVIHCEFESWRWCDTVDKRFRDNKGKINGVFVLQKYGAHTNERRSKAQDVRKKIRNENARAKVFIRYPAIVMANISGLESANYVEMARF